MKRNVFVFLQRSYNISLPHREIPDALCQLAKKMAGPAVPYGVEFRPEAAIVNYFGLGDLYCNFFGILAWVIGGFLPYLLTPKILQHTHTHTTHLEAAI